VFPPTPAFCRRAGAALDRNHPDVALAAAKESCRLSVATGDDWEIRLHAAYRLDDFADAVPTLTTMAARWPVNLANINEGAIFRVVREAGRLPQGQDKKLALLRALFAADWKPKDPFTNADALWLDLAALLLDRHARDEASRAVVRITAPGSMIIMQADRRFDALIAADPAHYDVMRAVHAAFERMRAAAAAAPDKLAGVNQLAYLLLFQMRYDEALALVDAALAKAANANTTRPPFSDFGDQINWAHDIRASALNFLGRHDEAVAAQRAAAGHSENDSINVSNAINLGGMLAGMARPREALEAVTKVMSGQASPYGVMQYQAVLACSYAQLGDAANLAKARAYVSAHVKDAPNAALTVALCANDADGAAALLVAALDDPQTRLPTLFLVQDFKTSPREGSFDRELRARQKAVIARADVQAAIARVGRVKSYDLLRMGS
jgi:tetratricopeptide (TPR) repeat protein